MARLINYKKRDENRYSTFLEPTSACPTQFGPARTRESVILEDDRANFADFNHFKMCDRQKIVNKDDKTMTSTTTTGCSFCCGLCNEKAPNEYRYDIDSKIAELRHFQHGRYNQDGTLKTEMTPPGRIATSNKWTWDESLRSNSDKFLETLEYDDLLFDRSLKRFKKVAKVRPIAYRPMGGTSKKKLYIWHVSCMNRLLTKY